MHYYRFYSIPLKLTQKHTPGVLILSVQFSARFNLSTVFVRSQVTYFSLNYSICFSFIRIPVGNPLCCSNVSLESRVLTSKVANGTVRLTAICLEFVPFNEHKTIHTNNLIMASTLTCVVCIVLHRLKVRSIAWSVESKNMLF